MAERTWAVFHDGAYHHDKIVFDPAIDRVPFEIGDSLSSLIAKYDDPKAGLIQGAFICPQRSVDDLCGSRSARLDWAEPQAFRQNAHRLQSLASGSFFHLGVLPGVTAINRSVGECDKIAIVTKNVEEFKRNRRH